MKNNFVKLIAIFALLALVIVSVVACNNNDDVVETQAGVVETTADSEPSDTKKAFKPVIETEPPVETEPPIEEDTSLIGVEVDTDTQFGGAVYMH